jgi:hypothetical protein
LIFLPMILTVSSVHSMWAGSHATVLQLNSP